MPIDSKPRNNDGGKAVYPRGKETCTTAKKRNFAFFYAHYQRIDRKNTKIFTRNPKKRKKALADESPTVV